MHDFENENVDIVIREEKEMSFRCIMMGSYNAEGAKAHKKCRIMLFVLIKSY